MRSDNSVRKFLDGSLDMTYKSVPSVSFSLSYFSRDNANKSLLGARIHYATPTLPQYTSKCATLTIFH